MSEENSKHCYNCRYYHPYYIKGSVKFEKCELGLCGNRRITIDKRETCDKFVYKYYARTNYKQAVFNALTEHINVLAEIKQILEEDDEEAVEELLFNFKNRKK